MREQVKDKGRLGHILDNIEKAEEFIKDTDFEQFRNNVLLRFAVTRAVEIVGEASYRLTKEFREKYSEIEWKDIISMRHILVHGYYQTEDKIVWDTVNNDFPTLKEKIQRLYETIN